MKKVILSLMVVSFYLASCSNSGTGSANNGKDSTSTKSATPGAVTNGASGAPGAQPGQPAAPAGPVTTVKFEESTFDFGSVKQGETVKHVFKFTNTGTHDLVITEAHGSCGCTVPNYPHEPVAAGASGQVEVSFNSTGKQGPQQKQVFITANTDPQQTILNITSNVQVPDAKPAGK